MKKCVLQEETHHKVSGKRSRKVTETLKVRMGFSTDGFFREIKNIEHGEEVAQSALRYGEQSSSRM